MFAKKLVGPEGASQKYDILTALGSFALAGPPGTQRLVLRFITLVTARYNWRLEQLSVGQREIARLWSVDERTVKREMAKLRELGWIVLETPARRGRVACYGLDLPAIREATRGAWERVGGDFEARMGGVAPPSDDTVVPFPRPEGARAERAVPEFAAASDDAWIAISVGLRAEDPAIYANWFEGLRFESGAEGALVLVAPSAFHANYIRTHFADRLLRATRSAPNVRSVSIVAGGPDTAPSRDG
jgi:hypothetical protein